MKESLSRGGRANLGTADEIDKAIASGLRRSFPQTLCPGVERIRRVTGRLLEGAAPQVGINEISGDLEVRAVVVDDEGHPASAQQVDERIGGNLRVAKFNDVPQRPAVDTLGQKLDERREGVFADRHVRGKLPQDRSERVAQFENAACQKAINRRAGTGEIGAMRRKARALEREDEIVRRLVVPAAEARRLLGTVEGAVDLDRSELAACVAELTCLLQARRLEDAAPRRKDPSADPDADLWRLTHPRVSIGSSMKDGVAST